ANLAPAQTDEAVLWPESGRNLWYWVEAQTDFSPGQIDAAFRRAVEEELAFLDPAFGSTVFFAKELRLTAGKARERKKYREQPAQADDIRIEVEWQTGEMNQYRGSGYRFIAVNAVRSLDLHYLPDLRLRFPKAPAGRNWNVNLFAGTMFNFFFRTEDAARNFINAVASALRQRNLAVAFSRFGLMWENVTPLQAAAMGRANGGGVLVTMVAVAGPADRCGIRPLDVVLEVNGVSVKNFSHFTLLLDGMAPGATASLLLLRRLKARPEASDWNTLTVALQPR
ncbi:MAG TPA: PDZ domain-containing protein, partial [Candidatus Binatia bacterium]|nr:PDZ domain-containing protein [Candidatus Binatia bacterium]